MNDNLQKAIAALEGSDCTCVLCRGDSTYTSRERGVKPLLDLLNAQADLRGFCAADKVVGSAAAFLYALLGVESVYAGVISEEAVEILKRHGIDASYGLCVKAIINRAGTGVCPMEQAVRGIDKPAKALAAIKAKLRELQSKK